MKRTTYYNAVPQVLDQWPIKKALTHSDVDITHPFLTLSRQQVETHIVVYMTPQQQEHLSAEGQVGFNAQDDDTGEMYVMKLKWRGSYYNLIGKWGKVVRGKGLEFGQEIKLRWFNGCLHFSVPQQQIVVVPPVRMATAPLVQDHWPIKEVLTPSDVDPNHPFLPLPRKSVEDHILVHWLPQERDRLRKDEQRAQTPGIQNQDLRRATDFLLDNVRIGNVRTHYDKYRRYVELNVDSMFTALVSLYTTMFRSQWQGFKRLLDAFTIPAGTEAYAYAARIYISHWFIDLYCSIREATRVISALAFNEMFDYEYMPYSHEYDAYLSLLNAAIRPTHIQYTSEDALYIPTFCKPSEGLIWDTNEDDLNPFTITNFQLSHDIFYGMLQVMKERKQWKFQQISTHSMGRPSWLFDWHDNYRVCAWFPHEGNYDDTDVTLAYILGVACTPKLGPCDVDDWSFDTYQGVTPTVPTPDIPRVVARLFYGSYEVRTIEYELDYRVPDVVQDYLEGLGIDAAKKKKAKKGKAPAATTSTAGGATQTQPSAPLETEVTSEIILPNFPRFRLIDWCYYSLVVVNIEWHTRTGALRTLIMS